MNKLTPRFGSAVAPLGAIAVGIVAGATCAILVSHRAIETPSAYQTAAESPSSVSRTPLGRAQQIRDLLAKRDDPSGLDGRDYSRLQRIVNDWMIDDVSECLNFLKQNRCLSLVSDEVFERTFLITARQSLAGALNIASKIESGPFRDKAVAIAFSDAGGTQPEVALEYADRVPDYLKAGVFSAFARAWVRAKGADSLKLLLQHQGVSFRLAEAAAQELAAVDFSSAVGVLVTEASASARARLLHSVFERPSVSLRDQLNALQILPEGLLRDSFTRDVATKAIIAKPVDAAEILASLRDPAMVSAVVRNTIPQMTTVSDRDGIAQFIEALPSTYLRTSVAKAVAGRIAIKDPQGALAWSVRLTDPVAQNSAAHSAIENWLFISPAAAADYVAAQMDAAPDSAFSRSAPAWLAQVIESPSLDSGGRVDLTRLRDVSPASSAILKRKLENSFAPSTWQKLQAFLRF